ncbi:MAG: glutamine-hydrolyzing carbamoyl-phosphate synthase small subunit [Candidatus Geothermarchaeales archaeon]
MCIENFGWVITEEKFPHRKRPRAILVLEDQTYYLGYGFGAAKKVSGEVVFSTSMMGYTEALTDPSYQGQILTLTYPLVGNYGVPPYDPRFEVLKNFESDGIKVTGLIIHELCEKPYHWAAQRSLDEWLKSEGVPGIYGVDTRRLTKKLRVKGVMLGVLEVCEADEDFDLEKILSEARGIQDPNLRDLVGEVSIGAPIHHRFDGGPRVVVIDCGVKYGILRSLLARGVDVVRVPYDFSSSEVLELKPSGIIISNGPGDPKKCVKTIECTRDLIQEDIPLWGICLGNQILALALGGDTYKLKYGHRSQNQPVLDLETGRCYITTQNHGYAVDKDTLNGTDLRVRYLNANDKTVEGIEHVGKPIFAHQWHPEGAPGPLDTEFMFDEFLSLLR